MLRNYFAAACRNFTRNKLVGTINIVGLALGFAAAILIALYVRYELSYDEFLAGHERVYRLSITDQRPGGAPTIWDAADFRMARQLAVDYPQIEATARLVDTWYSVRRGPLEYHEQVFCADADFFKILPFPALAGDLATALDEPDGVVITRTIARKYFGNTDPIGKTLEVQRSMPVTVRAVIEDLPGNTHFNFKIVASGRAAFATQRNVDAMALTPEFTYYGAHTYFRLRADASAEQLFADLPAFAKRHYNLPGAAKMTMNVYPLADVHFAPAGRWPFTPAGNPRTVTTIALVGLLVILIAAINFVNLMTARAAQRALEIGVRKSAGARQRDLVTQFLGEACLYVFVAMLIAVALVELALPTFNTLLSAQDALYQSASVRFDYWREPTIAGGLVLAVLVVGLLAGAYPAFVMAALRPSTALKGHVAGGASWVRQSLVVLQFTILIGLIFATLVIHRQTNFAMNEALRIDRDQVVLLHFQQGAPSDAFKDSIRRIPGVLEVTAAAAAPTNYSFNVMPFANFGREPLALSVGVVDFNFFDFYHLAPVAGRVTSREHGNDLWLPNEAGRALSVVLNESAVKALGFPSNAEAVGANLATPYWAPRFVTPTSVTVVGVVPDYPIDSVRTAVAATLFVVDPAQLRVMSIRLRGTQIPETLAAIDAVWAEQGEPHAVSRWFLEQYYQRMYSDIIQQRRVLGMLSAAAVFLACLGLFGLSIYTAQRRTREIGVRKALGAGTADVMRLLLWAFSKPVAVATVIAWPIAFWAMSRWLDGFVYRIDLAWWLLPLSSLVALGIALATVSAHCYAVARAQPARALRDE
jgi:putative ABC transport system permease protein